MWMSGRMLGIWARQMLVGLVFGQADEDVLELDDAAGDGSGIELVAVGDQISLLSLGQGVGVQEPAWRSAGSVVEALAPADLVSAPPNGPCEWESRGAQLDLDLLPEAPQNLALLAGVVAVSR